MLAVAEPFLERNMHPTIIVAGYIQALDDALKILSEIATPIDASDDKRLTEIVHTCIDTKFSARWGNMISDLAVKAAKCVTIELPNGKKEIDIKRYAKVEKIPGGDFDECAVLNGVMLNKDVTHPKMRRIIKNPKVVLLDCNLEYKKGESQTNVEVMKEEDWEALLKEEEEEIQKMCNDIINVGADLVFTEKGVSDLAQHFLMKKNISVIRRVRKTDNNRLARVTGAHIVNRTDELTADNVGTLARLFKIDKIGDEYYCYITECDNPKACTILMRGASKDVLNEIERNLQDALNVARNVLVESKLLPGGGATEMEIAARLNEKAKSIEGIKQWPYKAVAVGLEVIPRTLAQNCGADVVRTITDLRSRHALAGEGRFWGIDGNTGKVVNVEQAGIWDAYAVKQQVIKTAIEAAAMILRIDDVVSGIGKKGGAGGGAPRGGAAPDDQVEAFGDSRDG
mmetsp:Transcript_52186/g.131123  ORF Transcript_52186/g.131123 Transcript_52186/m.131123 type:complete len:455 (+) Transcript_52186:544-1908(+)